MKEAITKAAGINLPADLNARTGLKLHLPPSETTTTAEIQTTKVMPGAILRALKRANGNTASETINIINFYILKLYYNNKDYIINSHCFH